MRRKGLVVEGKSVEVLKESITTKTADLLVDGVRTDVKYMILDKNTAGHLAAGVKQVRDGGQIYWVRPANSKATLDQMKGFAAKFVPRIDGKKVNVTIHVIDNK